jgi:hypothetical protein
MPLSDSDLWCALQALTIGPGEAALPFAARLARDNGWTAAFADRTIEEYRRFLYLCSVAGRPVTPSDQVDQAWHLHLTYTRSYWDDLCGRVLGRPLHHGPTCGGPDERRKYDTQYRQTLELYESEFGEPPPADIWPDPAVRFGANYVRIDRNAVLTVDRGRFRSGVRHLAAAGLCLALGACAQVVDDLMTMSRFEQGLLATAIAIAVFGLIRWSLMTPEERRQQRSDGGGCGSGCGDCGCGGGCD